MGLQIVQDRVDALEGTLEVTSELGRGTRIAVRLPVHELEPAR
jgi:chemotaxis protein histidine kinase CheA